MSNKKTKLLGDIQKRQKKKTQKPNKIVKEQNKRNSSHPINSKNSIKNKKNNKLKFIILFSIIILFFIIPKPNLIKYTGIMGEQESFYIPPFLSEKYGTLSDSYIFKVTYIDERKMTICSLEQKNNFQCHDFFVVKRNNFFISLFPYLKYLANKYF